MTNKLVKCLLNLNVHNAIEVQQYVYKMFHVLGVEAA